MAWEPGPGVVELPDGTRVRGRAMCSAMPTAPLPQWSLFLVSSPPREELAWPYAWLFWRDFWLPSDHSAARGAFEEAHGRAADGARVEVVCRGGRGRTGTAIACIAQLGGVAAEDAVTWTRANYQPHAIETPWQRQYVRRFMSR